MTRCTPEAGRGPSAVEVRAGLPVIAFTTTAEFETWLSSQTSRSPGLWLKLAKKGSGAPSIAKQDAIEVALCHGWIDGQLNPYDAGWWLVRFTPRSARSKWSEINRRTAQRLIADSRMSAAGLAQVHAAKADGRWDAAYAPQSTATVPTDLQAALDASPTASRFFATLTGANRYAILYRIQEAKTAATRAKRIEKFIGMLERGEVLHPTAGRPTA